MRRILSFAVPAVLILSLSAWFLTRETLPGTLRIAAAHRGGLYYHCAEALGAAIEKRNGCRIEIQETQGSVENRERLLGGRADLAIIQGGTVDTHGLAILAPLYHEVIHVIARKNRGIAAVPDLVAKKVLIGPEGSGMRQSALSILRHYGVSLKSLRAHDGYFLAMAEDTTIDAAIVATGFLNPDLKRLLSGGDFELVPVLDGEALAVTNRFLRPVSIPRGLYGEGPAQPPANVPTVASCSYLVGPPEISKRLVNEALAALYEGDLQREIPTLIPPHEAARETHLRLHAAARDFHDPYGGIGLLANFMESIAAIKELLFALGAGLYMLWARQHRLREEALKAAVREQKEHLDALLNETVKIERAQMETTDPVVLKDFLNEVTRIKLRALEELTGEELRGDQLFAIFLAQCANLIRKIQAKIEIQNIAHLRERDLGAAPAAACERPEQGPSEAAP